MKTDLFQSCGHCWVFQICWHIECSTFTASSFRIWNSSTGIPSPPLALFIVMLSKAYLTSHSRMSGSRSVITPPWLSGWWRSFLYSSSVYSCHSSYWLDGRESGWTPGVGDGQGGLACYNSWGRKESDTTERLNWTELIVSLFMYLFFKFIYFNWMIITLQYCDGFCHTSIWIGYRHI